MQCHTASRETLIDKGGEGLGEAHAGRHVQSRHAPTSAAESGGQIVEA